MGGIGNEAMLTPQQVLDLRQQAVDGRLHGFKLRWQRYQLQRFQRIGVPPTDDIGHVLQRPQPPANGGPDQQRQGQATKQEREHGVADDPVDQVVTHIVTLADPDQPVLFRYLQDETAPLLVATDKVVETRGARHRIKPGGARRMHQQHTTLPPDLKCQLAFVRVAAPSATGLPQRFVESAVHVVTRAALHRHAHDPLKQARILGEMRVIHFVNFMAAVVVVVEHQQASAGQQQEHDPPECALTQRTHALPSTR